MVPNYRTGKVATYDRTEPMLGSWTVQILTDIFPQSWLVDLVTPVLLKWNTWLWRQRRAEGILGQQNSDIAGQKLLTLEPQDKSGQSNLICLGSDATVPPGGHCHVAVFIRVLVGVECVVYCHTSSK